MPAKKATSTAVADGAAATAAAADPMPRVTALRRLEETIIPITVIGVTPVIPHRWSEKAIRMMQEKQSGATVRNRREPKDPDQEAHDSCYWLNGSPAIPATAFKAAMVGACRFFDGITMTQAKLLFYVEGEGAEQLVPLKGEAQMRTDMPRNQTGVADIRYRYQIWPWEATLMVHYLPSQTDEQSVLALLEAGGRGGVGDWRPSAPRSATGTYGQFRLHEEHNN